MNTTTLEQHPQLCDLVMKGGITSGVIYPGAVVALAQHYRFHSIGGSSAGAIAAALTAAAEYRRVTRGESADTAFASIRSLPEDLGATVNGRSRLLSLFQPQPRARKLFTTLIALAGGSWRAPLRLVAVGATQYPHALLAALLPLFVAVVTPLADTAPGLLLQGTELVLLMLASALLALLALLVRDLLGLRHCGFGLCNGATAAGSAVPGLTWWLHARLQATAGRGDDVAPLCFGELWRVMHPYDGVPGNEQRRAIDLRVTTTNLTWQQLMSLPSDSGDYDRLLYRPDEFAQWFPPAIVDAMRRGAEARLQRRAERHQRGEDVPDLPTHTDRDYLPLPEPGDLPVLVAVRMSLSFPVLLTPIKLYAADRTRLAAARADGSEDRDANRAAQSQPRPVWFSDGGICSNMPVHFFDAPLPSHPTFAINLTPPHPDHALRPDKIRDVKVPTSANSGEAPYWLGLKSETRPESLFAFLFGVVDAARNWNDHTQMRLDGCRDRIMHIVVHAHEGGLNLDMPPALITTLSERGAEAARAMHAQFATVPPGRVGSGWDRHRWVRARTSLYAVAELMQRLRSAARDNGMHDAAEIETWIRQSRGISRLHPDTQEALTSLVHDLAAALRDDTRLAQIIADDQLGDPWQEGGRPQRMTRRPELRMRARL